MSKSRGTWITISVPGYSYLRKFPGRARRTRITVEAYQYLRFIPAKPKRKKKAKPKAKPRQKPAPKLPPEERAPFFTRPEWTRVEDLIATLEFWAEKKDSTFEVNNKIQHWNQATDWISPEGFVWVKPLKAITMKALGGDFIAIVAVWTLVYNRKMRRYQVWSRTRSFGLPGRKGSRRAVATSLEAAMKHREIAYKALLAQIEKADYVEAVAAPEELGFDPKRPIAWTVWLAAGRKQMREGVALKKFKPRPRRKIK